MRRLILVRHGESEANVIGSLHCQVPGPPLTDRGHEQAEALVAALASEDVRAVYASTMTRASQTAGPLAAALGLDLRIRDGLREADLGELHDRHDTEAHALFDDVFAGWALDADLTLRCAGGESAEEIVDRVAKVLAEAAGSLPEDGGTAVVVGHGAAFRLVLLALCGVDPAFALRHHLPNTGLAVLDVVPDGYACRSWGGLAPEFPVTHSGE
ncbi:MAG: histidine phosphatase family protein [Actinomycetia bacterium]|nr:histidine phosphatase family protein [Actinomycetes bacterium]